MTLSLGAMDVGVSFVGDASGMQKATAEAQAGLEKFGSTGAKELRRVADETAGAEAAMARLANGLKGAVLGGSVVVAMIKLKNSIADVSAALIDAQVQLDKWNNGFKFGTGSLSAGAQEMAFVRQEAQRLGLELSGSATQYMKLVAASRGTALEGQKTRDVFKAIAEAATVMGMSGEQSERAFMAVTQMMSKGKVQAEELRGQLGEHLPGAFAIAARAMGVTESELNKLMETGNLMAADFLPKFAAQLRTELAGSVEDASKSMQASLNRFDTAWLSFKQSIASSGVSSAMGGQINILADALGNISERMAIAKATGGGFWSQMGAGLVGVLQFANPLQALSYDALESGNRIKQAEKNLEELRAASAKQGVNLMLRDSVAAAEAYVAQLKKAKQAQDELLGNTKNPRDQTGYPSRSQSIAAYDKVLTDKAQEQGKAYADLIKGMLTPQEQYAGAVAEAKEKLGALYTPELEQRIRDHFIKPTTDGVNALAAQKAKLDEARQYAVNLQQAIASAMSGDVTDTPKQTESEKAVMRLQEQLATGIKGVARANLEKQLSVAQETVAVEKSNRVAEKQLQIQKDLEKQRDAEEKGISAQTLSIQEKTEALYAQLGAQGKTKVAAEEAALVGLQQRAADLSMIEGSDKVVQAILAKADAQAAYVSALKAVAYSDFNQHTDEILRSAKEQHALYQDELQLVGLTTLERNKIVALRAVELKYAKELDTLAKSGLTDEEKTVQRLKIEEAKRIESAAVTGKAIQAEYDRVSNQIEQSLTDALMRGFESGKGFASNLRDTVVNMFKTLVLRPVIQAVVNPVAGAITGSLGLAGTANAATSTASGLGFNPFGGGGLYNSIATSGVGQSLGLSSLAEDAAGNMFVAQSALGEAIGAAVPYIGAALAVVSLLKSLDNSGTMHTGGLGSYSAAGGSATGDAVKGQSPGFFNLDRNDYQSSTEAASVAMSKSIVGMLDATASTFGKSAGYYAATAFADDTSKDGAWGSLLIKLGDKVLADWGPGGSGYLGKEFADGQAGATQYASAVAKDVRDYLITQTPDWADAMLTALGDAPTLDQLSSVVAQINTAAAAMEAMGRASASFASLTDAATSALIKSLGGAESAVSALDNYYSNYYTEAERAALTTAKLTEQFGALGMALPSSREALRGLIDAALAAGNTDLAAKLIGLSRAFAGIASTATDAAAAATEVKKTAAELQSAALQSLTGAIDREKALWQTQADAAASLRTEVQGVFDTLASNITELRAQALGSTLSAAQGNAYIAQALAAAQAGAGLPDQSALATAISAARGGLDAPGIGNSIDRAYEAAKLAGSLTALQTVAGDQLTAAERQYQAAQRQIEQLDATLGYWKQQVDLAQGNVDATLSVVDAVTALQEALKPGSTTKSSSSTGSGNNAADASNAAYTGGLGATRTSLAGTPGYSSGSWVNVGGKYVDTSADTMAVPGEYYAAMLQKAYYSPETDMASTWAMLTGSAFAGSAEALLAAAKAAGLSDDVIASYRTEFLPKYAAGGYHRGGWAIVGEQGPELAYMPPAHIYTANQTASMLGNMGNTARLESLFATAVDQLAAMAERLAAIESATGASADSLGAVVVGNALVTQPAPAVA